MTELGHVVFYVRDLHRSRELYVRAVGLAVQAELFRGQAVMLSGGGTHHELLLIEAGDAPGPRQGRREGLYHVAWKLGESLEAPHQARDRVQALGHPIEGQSDHGVSQSLYLRDPDGNEVELFVDDPGVDWRTDRSWLDVPVRPLRL